MVANSSPVSDPPSRSDTKTIDVFDILRHHWWKIVLGSVVGVAAAVAYCVVAPPIHESSTEILILTKEAGLASHGNATGEDSVGFDYAMQNEMLATHLHVLNSPAIVRRAIEDGKLADLESIRSELSETALAEGEEATKRAADGYIRKNLVVERGGTAETRGAQVMKASFRHGNAEDAATVLSAVVEAYQNSEREMIQQLGGEAVSLIREERAELEARVKEYDDKYTEFVRQSPLQAQSGEAVNHHIARVTELETELSRLQIAETNARSRLKLVEKVLDQDSIEFDDLSMIDSNDVPRLNLLIEVDRNSPTAPVAAEYQRLREMESELIRLEHRLGANHPKVREQKAELEEFSAKTDEISSLDAIRTDDGINPRSLAAGYAELLRNDLADYESSKESINSLISDEMDAARILVETELQQRRYFRQLERAESAYDAVMDRIGELDLLSSYAGFTNVILKPIEPGNKVWPHIPLLVLAGALLGGLFALVFGFVKEVMAKSYRDPADVEDALAVPVLCHLPAIRRAKKTAESDVDSSVFALHRPYSHESEAIRKLRGSIINKTNDVDRPIVQIASPGDGEGKSTLASNLAVSVAQSRRRVLLIDCDLRSSSGLSDLFNLPSTVGLTDVLAGEARAEDAIQPTSVPGLSIVPCGGNTENSIELFTTPEFRQFLQQVNEEFDYVFIDSAGVLDCSESMAVADAADFVILTLGLSPNSRLESRQALGLLQSHDANVMGIVFNDSRKRATLQNGAERRMELVRN